MPSGSQRQGQQSWSRRGTSNNERQGGSTLTVPSRFGELKRNYADSSGSEGTIGPNRWVIESSVRREKEHKSQQATEQDRRFKDEQRRRVADVEHQREEVERGWRNENKQRLHYENEVHLREVERDRLIAEAWHKELSWQEEVSESERSEKERERQKNEAVSQHMQRKEEQSRYRRNERS